MAKISINMESLRPQREYKRHKINPGTSVFRILPPFGSGHKGYPFCKWILVWGLIDPLTGRMRPFTSTLINQNKCPVFEYARDLQVLADEMKVSGSPKEEMKFINDLISRIRPKTSFFYNAVDQSNQVGILELKKTAHDKLKKLMGEYIRDYNQDPTSLASEQEDSGVWFEFSRTGEGFDTKYDAKKHQTKAKINGQIAFVDNRAALPESVSSNYEQLGYDIHTLYTNMEYSELEEILFANIKAWNLPEKYHCGRNIKSVAPAMAASVTEKSAPEKEPAQVAKPTPSKRPPPTIKLDEEDDAESGASPVLGMVTTKSGGDDEIFAMARKILSN